MSPRPPRAVRRPALDPRRPDPLFDTAWYLAEYPDVAAATTDAWGHFVRSGEAEGRSPGPQFDTDFYRRTHLPLEGERPFTHYVTQGRARGHVPRAQEVGAEQSRLGIRAALTGRPHPVLLLGNDARAGGAPLLLLEIARRLRDRGRSPVFLLAQGGPLIRRFDRLGPTLIAAEGWDLGAIGAVLPLGMPVLANTGWGVRLAAGLGVGARTVALVQEMPDYLVAHDLLAPLIGMRTVVASMPGIRDELARLLPDDADVRAILPGIRVPSASRRGEARVHRMLAARLGAVGGVYIGAGYADARKGFDLFLEAAARITAQDPRAAFVWLGDLGAWARALADAAVADGVRLVLPGFRADADDWYAAADVYLLTSRQDPGPTTVMNAAAVGLPFVGLAADIGLRALVDVTRETGEYVDDVDALAARAVEVASRRDPAVRRRRAAFVRAYRTLGGYVDDLENVASDAAGGPSTIGRAERARTRVALRMLRASQSAPVRMIADAGSGAADIAERVRARIAPWSPSLVSGSAASRPVSIAVREGEGPMADESSAAQGAAAALPGDRLWIRDARHLVHVRERIDLHLVRDSGAPPWPLVSALEPVTDRIDRVIQYDAGTAPEWVRTTSRPPRAARSRPGRGKSRQGVVLAPHAPLEHPPSIAVFLHAYYPEPVPRIADRLALIPYPVSLHVSTSDDRRADEVRAALPLADIRLFPNRGRDIAPKVFGYVTEHDAHDLVLHLHTKRSPHRSDLDDWLAHILDCLLPSRDGIQAIVGAFDASRRLGMVSPAPHRALGRTGWGPNRTIAEIVTRGRGWPALPDDRALRFPAGSMFWARPEALRPLQRLAIPAEAFSDSAATDGTLAHAVERLLGVSCAAAGLEHVHVAPGRGSGS